MTRRDKFWAWLRQVDASALAEMAVLAGVLAIAALVSYTHLRTVWIAAVAPWPELGPLLVDGLFASAWLRMRRRRRQGVAVGWMAWFALGLALAATLAGNLAAAWVAGAATPLPYVVAAWPALAFALVWELVTGHSPTAANHPPAPAREPETQEERAERLLAEGVGRGRLAKALNIKPSQARQLIDARRQPVTNGVAP